MLYCQKSIYCSEWGDGHDPESYLKRTYWPSTTICQPPDWIDASIDRDLQVILGEVYLAINNEMPILTAIGVRTAFDRGMELLGIDPALRFEQKLDCLRDKGILSVNERKTLAALVDAGSAAAHRGWVPSEELLLTMIRILEAFLYKEFVLPLGLDQLVSSVPRRPKQKRS